MSTDLDGIEDESASIGTEIESLATELSAAIAQTEEHKAYAEAQQAVKESDDAQALIQEFESLRHEFMVSRQTGEASQEDLLEVQTAQQELHALPVMEDYLAAQAALEDRLEGINEALSTDLAIDFGEIAGACCQD